MLADQMRENFERIDPGVSREIYVSRPRRSACPQKVLALGARAYTVIKHARTLYGRITKVRGHGLASLIGRPDNNRLERNEFPARWPR
jgi:hypothetical protein